MWRQIALGVLISLTLARTALSSDRWICIRSANFELFTAADEKTGREALVFFEEVRKAFTEILGVKLPEDKPVTIIAFRDEQTFAQYRPHDNVAAFTLSQPHHDYIVMQDLTPEHYPVAMHEYTHVVIDQAGIKLPLWLNEGFAEVYATLTPVGRQLRVGRIIPGRLQMAQAGLIDLREVLSADRQSLLYHENDRVGIFYSESWALVHMLKFSEGYSRRFDRVLEAIGRGESSEQALQAVYGKTIAQIQIDLQLYVHGDHFREGVIPGRLQKSGMAPELAPVDPLDVAVMLTGIAARGVHRQQAVDTLEELVKANPGKLAPVESLAWIQLAGPNPQSAIAPFRLALEFGTRDANLCFEFAAKLRQAIPDADYVAALRRAAEIDPGFSAAQKQLAAHAFNSHDYPEAVARLHLVKKLERTQAFPYYRALSFATFQIGDLAEAKSAAIRAQQYAVTPEDKRLADEMLNYVSSGTPATKVPGFGENPLPPQI